MPAMVVESPADSGLSPLGLRAEQVAHTLRILANPDRLKMLCRIGMAEEAHLDEPTVTELVVLTGLSQSRVSQHLALLREAGVVAPRREGQAVRYRLVDRRVRAVMEALCHLCETGEPVFDPPPGG